MKYLVRVYWSDGRVGYARTINDLLITRDNRDQAENIADQLKASDDVDLAYAVPFSDRQMQSILRHESIKVGNDQADDRNDQGQQDTNDQAQDQDNTNDHEEMIMHAFYLTRDRADGPKVDRFTEVDQLFSALADPALDLETGYAVTTDYLTALTRWQ